MPLYGSLYGSLCVFVCALVPARAPTGCRIRVICVLICPYMGLLFSFFFFVPARAPTGCRIRVTQSLLGGGCLLPAPFVCVCVCVYVCVCARMFAPVCARVRAHMCAFSCVRACVCVCVRGGTGARAPYKTDTPGNAQRLASSERDTPRHSGRQSRQTGTASERER
jgi:hypothetical protein